VTALELRAAASAVRTEMLASTIYTVSLPNGNKNALSKPPLKKKKKKKVALTN
jgi:hypothetical protein